MKWLIGKPLSRLSRGSSHDTRRASASAPVADFPESAFADSRNVVLGSTAAAEDPQYGLLYVDIAEYARHAVQLDDAAQQRLADAIKTMIANVADNHGRIVHLAGDAVLAEFGNADSALHCAINVQLAARQWNAALAREQQVKFRIGLCLGDAISHEADSQALAFDLAARLQSFASPGGICVAALRRCHRSAAAVVLDRNRFAGGSRLRMPRGGEDYRAGILSRRARKARASLPNRNRYRIASHRPVDFHGAADAPAQT